MRNDSGLPNDTVLAHFAAMKADGSGVEIMYGDMSMMVERSALLAARSRVATIPRSEQQKAMASVDRALRAALPKVHKGVASKKRMDAFYADLLLWTALRETAAV